MNAIYQSIIESINEDNADELQQIFEQKLTKRNYYLHFNTPKDMFIPILSFLFDIAVLKNSSKCINYIGNFDFSSGKEEEEFINVEQDSDDPLKNAFVYNAEFDDEENEKQEEEEKEESEMLTSDNQSDSTKEIDFIDIFDSDLNSIQLLLILADFNEEDQSYVQGADHNSFTSLIDWYIKSNFKEDDFPETIYDALYIAANNGNLSIVEYLLSNGVNAERISKYGTTIFNGAVFKGNYKLIDILYEYNVEQTSDAMKRFPLHIATKLMDYDMAEYLLQMGADTSVVDWRSFSPIHIAAKIGCVDIIHLLIDYGALINKKDRYGRTPLHIAALYGQVGSCQALYEDGAEMEAIDKHGLTAMNFATIRKKKKVMKFFDYLGLNNTNMDKDYNNRPKRKSKKSQKPAKESKNAEMVKIIRSLR